MQRSAQAADAVSRISTEVVVETPEQIGFTFEVAGPSARMLAYLIDLAIRMGVVSVATIFIMIATGWASPELGTGLVLLLLFAVEWLYNTLLEWLFNGVTPGKKALGLRVVRTDGVAVDFVRAAMRNLLRAADIFPFFYATGLLTMFFTGTQRRLGDLAADTMVVREERPRLRDLPPLPERPAELPAGVLAGLGMRDRDLAFVDEFFRRRHLFSADRAIELAAVLADPIADRAKETCDDPERLLAGVLIAGYEARSSWYGRNTAAPLDGGSGTGGEP
jgi:uncharacterized RDD family membrane protein YckC